MVTRSPSCELPVAVGQSLLARRDYERLWEAGACGDAAHGIPNSAPTHTTHTETDREERKKTSTRGGERIKLDDVDNDGSWNIRAGRSSGKMGGGGGK